MEQPTYRAIPARDGLGVMLCGALLLASCDGEDGWSLCADTDLDGTCDQYDDCPYHPAASSEGAFVRGTISCSSPDGSSSADLPLSSLPVHTQFGDAVTDCTGTFVIPVSDEDAARARSLDVAFYYDNDILGATGATTRLRVMDDLEVAWGTGAFHFGFFQTTTATPGTSDGRAVLDLSPMVIATSECELWRIGTEFLEDFHDVRHAPVPGETLQFMRRSGVFGTTPYAFYDHVDLAANILDLYPGRSSRESTLYHESGHILRDVADGNEAHWHGDNVDYLYARCHRGTEIFEAPYAFHEGWADYWEQARYNGRSRLVASGATTSYCDLVAGPRGVTLTATHTDWVEYMIADRLLDLSDCVGGGDADRGDRILLETLQDNPNILHSLYQFETALCGAHDCCDLARAAPASCPPDYSDDSATCRGPDGHVIRHW